MQPAVNTQPVTDVGDDVVGGSPEKIHARNKQDGVEQSG